MGHSFVRGQGTANRGQVLRRSKRHNPRLRLRPRLESLERRDLLATYTTLEDTALVVNDTSFAGAVLVTLPEHGKVSLANTGGFVYSPNENFNGSDHFTYSISPPSGTLPPTTTSEIDITVTPVNDAPVAHTDEFHAQQNTALSIDSPGVLKNDTDVDSTSLTAILVSPATHGTVVLTDGGGFTYTPAADYTGPDSFTYKASDGQATSESATVYLSVASNSVVARDDSFHVAQNTALTVAAPGVLKNDGGIDGRPLTASLEPNSGPQHGTVELHADGSFTYTPNSGYVGPDSFVYRATDDSPLANPLPAASATAKVNLSVFSTTPIVLAYNDAYYGQQDTPLSIALPGVLKNDHVISSDANGTNTSTPLNIPLNSVLVTGPAHGTLDLKADGSFDYTPNPNFSGSDTFTYQAVIASAAGSTSPPTASSTSHDVATVTIYVRSTAPVVVAKNDTYDTLQNKAITIAATGVLKNDVVLAPDDTASNSGSPVNIPLAAKLVTDVTHGALALNADGSFSFTPEKDFTGAATFSYQAILAAGVTSPNSHDIATVTIYVRSIIPAPVANTDYYSVLQDTTLAPAAPGLLKNDVAVSDYPLVPSLDHGPAHGTLTLNGDGTFSYQPAAGYTGGDSFTYFDTETYVPPHTDGGPVSDPITVHSNTATVYLSVQAAHPPVYAFDDSYGTLVGTTLTIAAPGVLKNDTLFPPPLPLNPSGDQGSAGNTTNDARLPPTTGYTITAALKMGVSHGTLVFNADGSFTYTPADGFTGADTFTYEATASPSGSTAGGASAGGMSAGVAASASTNSATDPSMPCTIGGPCPTPPDNIATVTIYVKAPEPPPGPVAVNDSFIDAENTELNIKSPGVLANDHVHFVCPPNAVCANPPTSSGIASPINQPPTVALSAVLVVGPSSGTVTLNADGSFSYEPNANFVGTDSFTYQAQQGPTGSDGATLLSNIATVTIKVVPAIAHNDEYQVQQDTTLSVPTPGVLANDSGGAIDPNDPTAHALTATQLSGPLHGTLTLNADGSFQYVPNAGYSGPDLFTYRAGDGATPPPNPPGATTAGGDSNGTPSTALDVGIVRIYVRQALSGIQAHDDKFPATENTELDIPALGVLANDFGPVNVPVVATLVSNVQDGTLTLNGDGSFTYIPADGFTGEDHFTYTAAPAAANSPFKGSTANVTIFVMAGGATPNVIIGGDQTTTDESGRQNVTDWATLVSVGDDGQPASFTVTTDNPKLFAAPPTIDATGQLTYTPAPNVSGNATITVVTHDASGDTTQDFTIHVDKPHPLYNAANPYDVNNDKSVAPNDVLAVINYLNAHGDAAANAPAGEGDSLPYYDVNRDNSIAPVDALMIINALNAGLGGGNGEAAAPDAVDSDLLALVAQDTAEATTGRKRTG